MYTDPAYMAQTGTPAGGITINDAYVQAYKAGFEQAFQQSESKLQPFFEQESQNEEFQYFDRVGVAEAMTEDATRYGDNPNSEIAHDRRRIGIKDYELGKYVDEKDLKRVLTDPMNAYTQALLASGKRKLDDIIIDKFFGEAYVGKAGGTTRSFAEGVGDENRSNIVVGGKSAGDITAAGDYVVAGGETEGFSVGGDFGTAGSGLTLAKLRAARRTMLRLHAIDQDEIVNCFVSAKQLDDLLVVMQMSVVASSRHRRLLSYPLAQPLRVMCGVFPLRRTSLTYTSSFVLKHLVCGVKFLAKSAVTKAKHICSLPCEFGGDYSFLCQQKRLSLR
mgnify:CR=1 FL=1